MSCFSERLIAAEIEAYRKAADVQLEGWKARVTKGAVKREPGGWGYDYTVNHPPQYVTFDGEVFKSFDLSAGNDDRRFEAYREILKADGFKVDYKKSDGDANRAVDSAKQHFIQKQSFKVSNAIGKRKDIKSFFGLLEYNGRILGHLKVTCDNGDEFTLNMKMIINHRNTHGQYTSFYQYPARFHEIHIGGKVVKGDSETWMAEHFGGKKLAVKIKAGDLVGKSYVEDIGEHAGHTVNIVAQANSGFGGRLSPHYLRCKCSCGKILGRGKNDLLKEKLISPK